MQPLSLLSFYFILLHTALSLGSLAVKENSRIVYFAISGKILSNKDKKTVLNHSGSLLEPGYTKHFFRCFFFFFQLIFCNVGNR